MDFIYRCSDWDTSQSDGATLENSSSESLVNVRKKNYIALLEYLLNRYFYINKEEIVSST